jgi:hypothetical protein
MSNHYQVPGAIPAPPVPAQRGNRTLLIVAIVVGVLALCGFCGLAAVLSPSASTDKPSAESGGGTSIQSQPSGVTTVDESQPTSQPPSAADAEQSPAVAVMGEPFQVGNAQITVRKVAAVKQIGNAYLNKKGDYRVLTLTIKNTSKEQFTTDSSNFKLIGSDGAEYSTDSDTIMYMDSDDSLFLEAINPGISKTGKLIFAVPAAAEITAVRVMGGLGDEPVDCAVK